MLRVGRRLLQQRGGRGADAIGYVASDMDGTILDADHRLSEFTKRTLFALTQELKVPFIFATGRLHADVAVVNANLQAFFREEQARRQATAASHATAAPVFLITANGAVAHNARTNEVVLEECVPEALVRELYALLPASETRINTNLYQGDRWYCRMDWQEVRQFHKESGLDFEVLEKLPDRAPAENKTSPTPSGAVLEPSQGDVSRVTKVFFTSWDKPLLDQLEALLTHRYGDQLSVSYSASYCVDVTQKSATKANALRTVLSLLPPSIRSTAADPLTTEQEAAVAARMAGTISFGNDLNDASMLKGTGRGFLMGNSNPRLLEKCKGLEVIGNHDEDGVARKLCEVFGIQADHPTKAAKPAVH